MKKKLIGLLLSLLLIINFIPVSLATDPFEFNTSDYENMETVYDNTFDSKTKAQIYADWTSVHLPTGQKAQPVVDGWLYANWDVAAGGTGVGYQFNTAYVSAKYEFDVKYSLKPSGSLTSFFSLRNSVNAGNLYANIRKYDSTATGKGSGIGFYIYSSQNPGKVEIILANADATEVLSQCAYYLLDYPQGVTFTEKTAVTVYDMDDTIMVFVEGKPFFAITLDGLTEGYYTTGNLYNGSGALISNFAGKKVQRSSNFAFANRVAFAYLDNFKISTIAPPPVVNEGLYTAANESFTQVYSDNFDGKTSAEIYAKWNGVYAAKRSQPVTDDGWLMADWDTTNGLGYSFKSSLINTRYQFDIKYNTYTSTNYNGSVVLRTASDAGSLYGDISPGAVSAGAGVGFYFYSTAYPGKATIVVADAGKEVLSTSGVFPITYPTGVDFLSSANVTIYDLDDLILYFVNQKPFAAISLSDFDETKQMYLSGTVYDGAGTQIGSFTNKKVPRGSNIAMTNRTTMVMMDNFTVSKNKVAISEVSQPRISVPMGTGYAEALVKLPNYLTVSFEDGSVSKIDVTWDVEPGEYDASRMGSCCIKGTLLSDTYDLTDQSTTYASVQVCEPLPVIAEGRTQVYQFTAAKDILMMGYIIKTKTGKLVVIDGGFSGNETYKGYLFDYLKQISGSDHPVIEAWYLSHLHEDHSSEFARIILNHKDEITIKNIFFNFPKRSWLEANLTEVDVQWFNYELLEEAFDSYYGATDYLQSHVGVQVGDMFVVDDVTFDVMITPIGTETTLNDTSIVINMRADGQNILFLGDLAKTHGNRLVAMYGSKLKSDIVQMAHHGQGGVDQNVYQLINPSMCLWPTPDWLWYNTSGIYQTLVVRGWMEALGVKHNIVTGLSGNASFILPYDFSIPPNVSYVNAEGTDMKSFKNDRIYLNVQKQSDKAFRLISALYKGNLLEDVRILSSDMLPDEPFELFDLTGKTDEDYAGYAIKTFVWKTEVLDPLLEPKVLNGSKTLDLGYFDDGNAQLVYQNNFDGKTAQDIYADWGGAHNNKIASPVEDGWLKAYWDATNGVGYYLKTAYTNAKYSFKVKTAATGSYSSFIALRTTENAGGLFNDFNASSREIGNGIGFFIRKPGSSGAAIVVADKDGDVLSGLPVYELVYPKGVDFSQPVSMDIYDLDDRIFILIEGQYFASIYLSDLENDCYHAGTIFNSEGQNIGSFTEKAVRRSSNFGIAQRTFTTYLDDFSVYQ